MLLLRDDVIREAMAGQPVIDGLEVMLGRPVEGALELPPRMTIEDARNGSFLRLMPCIAYDTGYAGFKAMNYHPEHGVRYMIALIARADGELVALLDADWITAFRTAATVAIAVRHLAPQRVETMTMIGSGTQARALLEAVAAVLTPGQVLVYSPTAENRDRFAADIREQFALPSEAVSDAAGAINASEVVLSAFRAGAEPVIHADAVRDGALVCGISSVRPEHREVDVSVWETSRVFVDDLAHVRQSGDGRAATELGFTADGNVRELWELLRDPTLGRRSRDERVLFKSVGTAEQDIALAALVVDRARELGVGEQLDEFPSRRPIQSRRASASDAPPSTR
ncbi:MAG TPA: ornithine cyclodeaminase family protein [Solirubrobacteraceae bacterium]|nr:ornithine cyclodeaminase family protein [Solirubrobacteraceae bacterium]